MRLGLALLRWLIGGTFMAHGAQKLFGAFGGPGLEDTAQGFEQMGLRPGKRNALAAGLSEFGGGALLVAGAAIPLATTALTATMTTAIWTVHKDRGFFAASGGFEYPLVVLGALFAITDQGPGALALGDDERTGLGWALASLTAGVGAGFAAMAIARRGVPQEPAPQAPTQAEGDGQPAQPQPTETQA